MKDSKRNETLAGLIARRLIQRRDVQAEQSRTGAYRPIEKTFSVGDLTRHFAGETSLGHYLLDQDSYCRAVIFDVDFADSYQWEGQELNPRQIFGTDHPAMPELVTEMRVIADVLAWRLKRRHPELVVFGSFSGSKGVHIYGSFPNPIPASVARKVGISVLEEGFFEVERGNSFYRVEEGLPHGQGLTIELFPKQTTISNGGYGNLASIPLGVNQKSGRRRFFYDFDAPVSVLRPIDPVDALRSGLEPQEFRLAA